MIQKVDQDEQKLDWKTHSTVDADGNLNDQIVVVVDDAQLVEAVEVEADYDDVDDVFAEADAVLEARIEVAQNCLVDYVAERHILADFVAMIFGGVWP